ncbi:MAG: (2Fe-2S)-binding protein [Deltaproteobacteria bacterium]|nr:MAG: (2Fe-2S)-binding protein [Deltaproteobacteria bacterium]
MILCLCEAVNDRTIDTVIRDGAHSVREIGRRCGAGTGCGLCKVDLRERLAERRERDGEPEPVLSK